jgi:hypothetical protein
MKIRGLTPLRLAVYLPSDKLPCILVSIHHPSVLGTDLKRLNIFSLWDISYLTGPTNVPVI